MCVYCTQMRTMLNKRTLVKYSLTTDWYHVQVKCPFTKTNNIPLHTTCIKMWTFHCSIISSTDSGRRKWHWTTKHSKNNRHLILHLHHKRPGTLLVHTCRWNTLVWKHNTWYICQKLHSLASNVVMQFQLLDVHSDRHCCFPTEMN